MKWPPQNAVPQKRTASLPIALIALVISGVCLAQSWRAVDAAQTAISQAHLAHKAHERMVVAADREHVKLGWRVSAASDDADLCHRRVEKTLDALEAVAKTCPGRFRAPQALEDARALEKGRTK